MPGKCLVRDVHVISIHVVNFCWALSQSLHSWAVHCIYIALHTCNYDSMACESGKLYVCTCIIVIVMLFEMKYEECRNKNLTINVTDTSCTCITSPQHKFHVEIHLHKDKKKLPLMAGNINF